MKKSLFTLILIISLLSITAPSHAIQPMPEKTGFSGFINIGAGVMNAKNNMVAGNDMADMTPKRIDSISGSPKSDINAIPLINFELNYTISETRTQIIAGNRLEDLLRFDTSSILGIRQELPDKSSVSLFYAFSPFATSVWEDPYLTGEARKKTNRTGEGLRMGFDRILGTQFETEFTWRKISIDTETSGTSQALTPSERDLLNRNGHIFSGKVTHPFSIQKMRHKIIPTLEYSRYDLEGDAMAFNRYGLLLSYLLIGSRFNVITNLMYARSDFDEENRLFIKTRRDEVMGASLSLFYKRFLKVPAMNLVGTIAHYEGDSTINFYDSRSSMATLSILYRF